MKFKDILTETPVESGRVMDAVFNGDIPLTTKMIRRLKGGKFKRRSLWHITDEKGLRNLIKIQGSKKQISTMSDIDSAEDITDGSLLSQGGIVVKLKGDIILAAPEDIYTNPDKQGRRWVDLISLVSALRKLPDSKEAVSDLRKAKVKILKLLAGLMKKYKLSGKDFKYQHTKQGSLMVRKLGGKFIKEYIDGVEDILSDIEINYMFIKVLQELRVSGKKHRIEEWDELVVNNIEIEDIYVLTDQSQSSRVNIDNLDYLNGKYNIHSVSSKMVYNNMKKAAKKMKWEFLHK